MLVISTGGISSGFLLFHVTEACNNYLLFTELCTRHRKGGFKAGNITFVLRDCNLIADTSYIMRVTQESPEDSKG